MADHLFAVLPSLRNDSRTAELSAVASSVERTDTLGHEIARELLERLDDVAGLGVLLTRERGVVRVAGARLEDEVDGAGPV